MRLILLDYSGHPFQAELSRELASRGHEVLHLSSGDFQTPKGRLNREVDDPSSLQFEAIRMGEIFQKDTFLKRRAQEQKFGSMAADRIIDFGPEIVISSNVPLDAQVKVQSATKACGAAFIFWIQDIYSEAIGRILRRKFGLLGSLVGTWYRRLEFCVLRKSEAIVAISHDFIPVLQREGVDAKRITVVENWAPLDEIPAAAPVREAGRKLRFLYSGTLGYKHNPALILALARSFPIEVTVRSEGRVADELKRRAEDEGLANIHVNPWVAYAELASTLHGADVFIAMIEADAGAFSVPSKVLSYMCAGRPILGAIPGANLAARIVVRERAGLISEPNDDAALLANAEKLIADTSLRWTMSQNARAYAESAFNISVIGDKFEKIMQSAIDQRRYVS